MKINKQYYDYLTEVEYLCQLIAFKSYRGYKGTKKEKLKRLEKLVYDFHDSWRKAEEELDKELDKVAGYDEYGNAVTVRQAFDLYDFKNNKPGIKLTKKKPKNYVKN